MFRCLNTTCRAQLSGSPQTCPVCGSSIVVRPGARLGEYLVEAHIEDGAVGTIWRARHLSTNAVVALKVLPYDRFPDPKQREEAIARFAREIQTINQLQKQEEHFVPIYDISVTSDGSPYFAMEFLAGETLSRYLAKTGPLPGAEILDLMGQLCHALQAVHSHPMQIIHRDIKPDNIFLVPRADGGHLVKLLDFGLAKLDRKTSLTHTNHALGTPHYMAPEQWQNAKHVDHRADLYSLGLVLFELLTGRRPFAEAGEAVLEIMRSHVLYPPPPPSRFVPWRGLSADLDALLQKTLAKRPEARPPSCAALYQALLAAMQDLQQEDRATLEQKKNPA